MFFYVYYKTNEFNFLILVIYIVLIVIYKIYEKYRYENHYKKFISENYFKKKKQKKSTKNYSIYSRLGDYILCKNDKLTKDNNTYWVN